MNHQTTLEVAEAIQNQNISYYYGTAHVVRKVMEYLDLYSYLDTFKERGVSLGKVVESLCIMHLSGNSSMNSWSEWCNVNKVMSEEMTNGEKITRKTYERCLARLDQYFEDITMHLNDLLWTAYPDLVTDVYVDGSHIPRAGGAGENVKYGEGGGKIQLQDQFVVAQLVESGLPIMVELYPGNQNDPQQYSDFIPQLMFFLKRGSTIIMDQGGSSADLLKQIKDNGNEHVTRVNLNNSDLKIIKERISEARYIGYGTACIVSEFESSGRVNYLFFSVDTLISELYTTEREVEKQKAEAKVARDAIDKKDLKNLVNYHKNQFVKVKITGFTLKVSLDPWMDIDYEEEARKRISESGGWFKISSSTYLDPAHILQLYRHRVAVEHLISSLKSVVSMAPLRVWKKEHERGALLLGLISQLLISIVRYEMEAEPVEKKVDGKRCVVESKPSFQTICDDLKLWTMTIEFDDGFARRHESNRFGCVPKVEKVLEVLSDRGKVRIPPGFSAIVRPKSHWDSV